MDNMNYKVTKRLEEHYSNEFYFEEYTYNHLIDWDWIDCVWLIFD